MSMIPRMLNAGLERGPRDLPASNVWPRSRLHLLDEGHTFTVVTVIIKSGWILSENLLHFHYPSLFEDERVLFCDTGDHIVVYIVDQIDNQRLEM